jgi:proline dehydrogenase
MIQKLIAGIIPYMPQKLMWEFSKKYIAGAEIANAIAVSKKLNADGCMVTIDLLGEFITQLSQAEENKNNYLSIIQTFTDNQVQGNFSVKPTSFGLLLDANVCYQHIREVVALAAEKGSFVRIDMEDSACVDLEIELYRQLKAEFPNSVGLVLQAYLKRTYNDVEQMMDSHSAEAPLNFRLCKGIYIEPESIAYKKHDIINQHYLSNLELMLQYGIYVGIATHDKYLVHEAFKLIEKLDVPKDKYEFQMLYGVTPELRQEIVSRGHRMRVYVPYGKDWMGYCTRRLKENPNMVGHIVKSIFVKG